MKFIIHIISVLVTVLMIGPAGLFAAEPINIGAILSFSGDGSSAQQPMIEGVRLAVAEINAQGGLLGRPVAVVWEDDQNAPIPTHIAATRALAANVVAIVGPARSSNVLVAGNVAQAHQIPLIAPTATAPAVTQAGDYVFRVCFSDTFQGRMLAEFVRAALRADTAIIAKNVSSDYSMELARIFRDTFEARGGRIVADIEYVQHQQEFKDLLAPLVGQPADVLFAPGYMESGLLVKHARELGITAIPVGGDGWATPAFLQQGGNTVARGYYVTHWAPELDRPQNRRLIERYGAAYAINPGMALAYDAVGVLADAIRRAGTTEPAALRAALADTRAFQGVTGEISFDRARDPVKTAVIMEILDGVPQFLQEVAP